MKILWITGALLPEATAKIKGKPVEKWSSTGSWILGASKVLAKSEDVQLYIAATSQAVEALTCVETGNITSYAIPYGKGHFAENKAYGKYMKTIHDVVQPDIIHIHGTEYSHSLAYLRTCGSKHVVISIQGMTSACYHYFHSEISIAEILRHISFRDLIRGGILREKNSFKKRGEFEREMIQSVSHIIGRTSWDYAHVKAINPNIIYHHGDETLRDEFYTDLHWHYGQCLPHSIVVISSYSSPFKGLHQVLKALPIILREYPDTHVKVLGQDPTFGYQSSQWWRVSGYGRYIISLIKKLNLREKVSFIGPKSAEEMRTELLRSNLFLLPSAIENSPNSLAEAQILGVPCVASYVGGVPDMMKGCEENLYRYEEIEMMAEIVCRVFRKKDHQVDISSAAAERHNPEKNLKELIKTYNTIVAMS